METYKLEIFKKIKSLLGAPIRKVEITDEQFSDLLQLAIEDYSSYIQEWLIENQWTSLFGKDINKDDVAFSFISQTTDFESEFSYAYSKQVGLQQRGPWELKKDYFELEYGRQVYEIPENRELNQVLWITPPTIDHALYGYWGSYDGGFGNGYGSIPAGGFNGGFGGMHGYYIAPAYDILARDNDIDLKSRILRSELTYKVTAGPEGTRLVHLMSIPGSRLTFGSGRSVGGGRGLYALEGCKVWYFYYDTSGKDADECKRQNKDIIKTPTDVPIDNLTYQDLNDTSKIWVRRYLTSLAKETLGRTRGKFSGKLPLLDNDVTLDYQDLLSEAKEEREKQMTELRERLERLRSDKMLERRANEAENINKSLNYVPMKWKLI